MLPGNPGEPRPLSEDALERVEPMLALLPSTEVDKCRGYPEKAGGSCRLTRTWAGSSGSPAGHISLSAGKGSIAENEL